MIPALLRLGRRRARTAYLRTATFLAGPRGRRALTFLRYAFMAGVVAYLILQFVQIGWQEILASLPTQPLFYLIFVVIYLSLPVAETLIYKALWHFRFWEGLSIFVKKRVLNKDVLGYSGEVYLYLWAKQRLDLTERQVLGAVKDNTIVSSVSSTVFAFAVLAVLLTTGQLAFLETLTDHEALYAAVGVLLILVVGLVAVRFRRTLFHLSWRWLGLLAVVHFARLAMVNALQIAQWAVVLPGIELQVWFSYLAVLIVTSRIPLLPGRDLIFLGAGVELSRMMDVPTAGIAGMLLASSVLDKATNLVMFSVLSFFARKPGGVPSVGLPTDAGEAGVTENTTDPARL